MPSPQDLDLADEKGPRARSRRLTGYDLLLEGARYAAAAVIDLASQAPSRPTTLAAIAKRQNISVSYLEQLFARLRAAGLLKSVRGPGGGYVLARASQEITIADIYSAVLEPGESARMSNAGNAKTAALWQAVEHEVIRFLRGVTVHDVMADKVAIAALP